MNPTSSISTNQSGISQKQLEALARRLVTGFTTVIPALLEKNSTDAVKRTTWNHLEKQLINQGANTSNIDQVLATAKQKLYDLIDAKAQARSSRR